MVGLPGCGKSFIARAIVRHLDWIGLKSRIFSVKDRRRKEVAVYEPAEYFEAGLLCLWGESARCGRRRNGRGRADKFPCARAPVENIRLSLPRRRSKLCLGFSLLARRSPSPGGEGEKIRIRLAAEVLNEALEALKSDIDIAIYDASNINQQRRRLLKDSVAASGLHAKASRGGGVGSAGEAGGVRFVAIEPSVHHPLR